ncbi:HemK methyltransferase member 2, variant 2 [Entomophthora muscae]|uniref:HemK methyltransferase member 2, variant 2 n=2 Tax=Entomophthora muscae TaxID=34485 RepID=A0ACC2U9R6_9FUNG|nr:HemK methyltransferase member 2, variant 2 [Entomophthora muscae]
MTATPLLAKDIDFLQVYEPAEDTFALLDCLEEDSKTWAASPKICLEVGCGTGMALAFLGKLLSKSTGADGVKRSQACPLLLATDLNPYAAITASSTLKQNQLSGDIIQCDLVGPLMARLSGKIDILLFNPPYVPTESDEVYKGGQLEQDTSGGVCKEAIAASWAGGIDGREVIDRLLPLLPSLLSPDGMAYLVTVNENKPHEIADDIASFLGLKGEIKLIRRAGRERLHIVKLFRS